MKIVKPGIAIVTVFFLAVIISGPALAANNLVKKVIIDTDMGWDDTLSTLYLLKDPNIEIVGMTVTGCGETNLRWGTIIAKTLMELGNRPTVSVCKGTEQPLKFDHKFPQSFRDDMNDIMGLLGSLNPEIDMQLDPRPAWQYLSETLNRADEKITILALGGFTNLAKMLQLYPDTQISNIEAVYAMAGAVFVDGNVALLNNARPEWDQGPLYATNHYAEWNIFVDPLAAQQVFASEIPLTLIPLDACDYVMLSPAAVATITGKDDISALARNILNLKTGSHKEGIPVPIFDPLATMVMANGLESYAVVKSYLSVSLEETATDNHCGQLLIAKTGKRKISIVEGVSSYRFKIDFAAVLNRYSSGQMT